MSTIKFVFFAYFLSISVAFTQTSSTYDLWLGYGKDGKSNVYQKSIKSIYFAGESETQIAAKEELTKGLNQMMEKSPKFVTSLSNASLFVATKNALSFEYLNEVQNDLEEVGEEGFILKSFRLKGKNRILLTANTDKGILYGVFRLLRIMQMKESLSEISIVDAPKIDIRMLNHWDNLDRTVERGYAGFSLWNWQKLPGYIDQRYIDYARANASIGINSVSLTNVNANAQILTPMYLEKVKALADVFRPYGIKVFLTARFSAPIELGGLETADPLEPTVQAWWNNKVSEIYKYVPDFGGFLVKANSEGQPGPQNYNRSHADGANLLAKALKPHDGLVIWRAFVYSDLDPSDRAKQAYSEFVPMDGQFENNVLIQSKNGAIDFQPREPFHPMFGAMPKTPLMMEYQITQEYLGFSTHLVYLPKLFEEVLDADTKQKGDNSTVAKVIDGSLHSKKLTGMAGVANIGTDINWTGHPFAQANWYGFGRLAWDPYLSSETIAEEWLKSTFTTEPSFVNTIKNMMITSREAVVNYMNPYGLHHLFDTNHHYGPGPWVSNLSRPEWNPTYYHKADKNGIGFDRTPSGSNATAQYAPEVAATFNNLDTCPEELLLWFHHVPWDYKLKNGQTLWNGMALKYQEGVNQVKEMKRTWENNEKHVSPEVYKEVSMLLEIQLKEAIWWKDASLLYFQTFSNQEIPEGVEKPTKTLEYYQSLKFPFAPGIRPHWD
ncbi:alpha-glucuronidase [Spirosomataceae bacterium TFI 002]|nr:alpha-glucuronidase [Spirosomataceae bacterium TFI 002]